MQKKEENKLFFALFHYYNEIIIDIINETDERGEKDSEKSAE
jgi:hypothetical protein